MVSNFNRSIKILIIKKLIINLFPNPLISWLLISFLILVLFVFLSQSKKFSFGILILFLFTILSHICILKQTPLSLYIESKVLTSLLLHHRKSPLVSSSSFWHHVYERWRHQVHVYRKKSKNINAYPPPIMIMIMIINLTLKDPKNCQYPHQNS